MPTHVDPDSAPELSVSQWFNSGHPISLAALRGKVVMIHALFNATMLTVQLLNPQMP